MFVRSRAKYIIPLLLTILILDYFGSFTHMFEENYEQHFKYPIDGDCLRYAKQMRAGEQPDVAPINWYNHTFLHDSQSKCMVEETFITPRLVIIIKSALDHFQRRLAIRKSWGFERRFSDVQIRTVFLLGIPAPDHRSPDDIQKLIDSESDSYGDIVQADFHDTYYNNTIKTMMGIRWSLKYCPRSKFYMFVDDDYYVSVKNVLSFLRNPVNYPEYLEEADEELRKLARRRLHMDRQINRTSSKIEREVEEEKLRVWSAMQVKSRQLLDMELPNNVRLFAGYVSKTSPHRHKSSKWYVPLDEYKWDMWPPYINAGSFILSREAIIQMYFTSLFTKHFRFDDIFLGLVALKAKIQPLHSEEFQFYKAPYSGPHSYKYLIVSHGYDDSEEMIKVWSEVRSDGFA